MLTLFTMTVTLASSCRDSKQHVTTAATEIYSIETVNFLNARIPIPEGYVKVGIDELGRKLEEYKGKEQTWITANAIETIKNSPDEKVLYTDINSPTNAYWIIKGQFVDLDREIAKGYVQMLIRTLKSRQVVTGVSHSVVSTNFKQTKDAEYIKVKVNAIKDGITLLQTQYIITAKSETFTVIVMNEEGNDFEYLIQNI